MTTIVIDPRGVATLPIEGHDGTHDYTIEAAPEGLDDWACLLQRTIPGPKGEGGPHRVALGPDGVWRCSCDAWRYRKSKEGPRGCKHTRALAPLYALLSRLTREESTV